MYMKTRSLLLAAAWLLVSATATRAQQTTGTIGGRVLDEQKAAVPGATVTAKNDSTGFARSEVSDTEGVYRITGLPVGDDTVDLLVHRWRGGTSAEVLGRRGPIDVIIHV